MTDFCMGDWVKVTIEGELPYGSGAVERSTERPVLSIGMNQRIYTDCPNTTIELISRPARWTDGDVIVEKCGSGDYVWTRWNGEWHRPGDTYSLMDSTVSNAVINMDSNVTVLRKQSN